MLALLPLGLLLAANPYLNEGQRLFEGMRYPEAEARLRTAREVPTSTVEERRQVYDLLARSVAAQGRFADVEALFAELLANDADAPAPHGVAPKIRDAFQRAKLRVYPPPYATLTALPAAPGRIELQLVDSWQAVSAVVLATAPPGKPFTEEPLAGASRRYEAALPSASGGLSYFVEARGADGRALAALGSREAPLQIAPPTSPAVTLSPDALVAHGEDTGAKRWPAWLVGGASVAALAAGVALAVSASADDHGAHAQTEARDAIALSSSARGKAIAANVLVGAALVGGAGTAVMVWRW